MRKLTGSERRALLGSAMIAAALTLAGGVAHAGLIIVPNGSPGGHQADPEAETGTISGGFGFPCAACTAANMAPGPGNAVTTFGYQDPAILKAQTAGWYRFTYYGAGNATETNTFTSSGGTFQNQGVSTPAPNANPTTFVEFLNAGQAVPFTFSSTDGCSVTNGTASTRAGCDYLIALQNSPTSPGAVGPQLTAFIGLSDGFTSTDTDDQDLVVRVDDIPEPASLGLMIAGLLGLARLRGRRRSN